MNGRKINSKLLNLTYFRFLFHFISVDLFCFELSARLNVYLHLDFIIFKPIDSPLNIYGWCHLRCKIKSWGKKYYERNCCIILSVFSSDQIAVGHMLDLSVHQVHCELCLHQMKLSFIIRNQMHSFCLFFSVCYIFSMALLVGWLCCLS